MPEMPWLLNAEKSVASKCRKRNGSFMPKDDKANRRGRAQPPRAVPKPHAWVAHAPLKTWSWDITFLPTAVRGQFYRLYMVMDVYSRMIVGWEIHEDERAEHAATLITKACLRHRVRQDAPALHADNGS